MLSIFLFTPYYPSGGFNDFIGTSHTIEEAMDIAKAYILDRNLDECTVQVVQDNEKIYEKEFKRICFPYDQKITFQKE